MTSQARDRVSQAPPQHAVSSPQVLQRKCACGQSHRVGDRCAACAETRQPLDQRLARRDARRAPDVPKFSMDASQIRTSAPRSGQLPTTLQRRVADVDAARGAGPESVVSAPPGTSAPRHSITLVFGGFLDHTRTFGVSDGPVELKLFKDLNASLGSATHQVKYYEWTGTDKAVADVRSTREEHGEISVYIVGHSYGGDAAIEAFNALAARGIAVESLITLDPVSRLFADTPEHPVRWTNVHVDGIEDASDLVAIVGGRYGAQPCATNVRASKGVSHANARALYAAVKTIADSKDCSPPPRQKERTRSPRLDRSSTSSDRVPEVSASVYDVLRSPGQPLDQTTRQYMEPRFGHDFSRVRVHTDAAAARSARAMHADAYTVGRDVVFEQGQYAPSTLAGKQLLAHELTHVVQQGFAVWQNGITLSIDSPVSSSEVEAARNSAILGSELHPPSSLPSARGATRLSRKSAAEQALTGPNSEVEETAQDSDIAIELPVTFSIDVNAGVPAAIGESAQRFIDPLPTAGSGLTRFAGPTTPGELFGGSNLNLNRELIPRLLTKWNDAIGVTWAKKLRLPNATSNSTLSRLASAREAHDLLTSLSKTLQKVGVDGMDNDQLRLLKQVVRAHAEEGLTAGSPFVSATELPPDLAIKTFENTKGISSRAYVVRVSVDPKYIAKVNEVLARSGKELMASEMEVLVAHDIRSPGVSITSVKANSAGPLGGNLGKAIKWGGKAIVVLSGLYAIGQVSTASGANKAEQQGKAFGSFAGGVALGAFGAGFCIGAGIATGGIALALCGLGFGLAGAFAGEKLFGAIGKKVDQESQ